MQHRFRAAVVWRHEIERGVKVSLARDNRRVVEFQFFPLAARGHARQGLGQRQTGRLHILLAVGQDELSTRQAVSLPQHRVGQRKAGVGQRVGHIAQALNRLAERLLGREIGIQQTDGQQQGHDDSGKGDENLIT